MADVNDRLTDRLIYIRQRFLKYRKKSHVKNHMFKSHEVKSFLHPIFYVRDAEENITNSDNEIFEIKHLKPHLAALLLAS